MIRKAVEFILQYHRFMSVIATGTVFIQTIQIRKESLEDFS
jgi:hypothetical protein